MSKKVQNIIAERNYKGNEDFALWYGMVERSWRDKKMLVILESGIDISQIDGYTPSQEYEFKNIKDKNYNIRIHRPLFAFYWMI